jgi:hypothetical protein
MGNSGFYLPENCPFALWHECMALKKIVENLSREADSQLSSSKNRERSDRRVT